MLIHDFLSATAARRPEKVALICDGQRLTYAELDARSNRLASALIEHDVRRGDRVAIFLPNSVEAVVAIFATLKAGAVMVVINHTTKAEKLAFLLNNCRARALLVETRTSDEELARLKRAVPSLGLIVRCGKHPAGSPERPAWIDYAQIQAQYGGAPPPRAGIDLDLACLIYTSGSTGEPKGVMSDHSNMTFVSQSIIEYLRNTEDDIILNALPLSFGYGLYQPLMTAMFGGTLVLERSFTFPAAVLKRIEQERVTGFPGVPTMYALMLQMNLGAYNLSSLRYITNAAAALPVSHILELRQRLPDVALFSMYGLTEVARALYMPPDQLDQRPDSVGIAIPGTEVWLEDQAGNRLGPGQVGELVVRGRHVMRGYWEAPGATAQRFGPAPVPGERVCYTGDLFRMDEAGYLYFVSRKEDIIKTRGEKVAPKEIENLLYTLPGVVAATVIGVPDPILGQAVKAFVVLDGVELSEKAIRAYCAQHLEEVMVPRYIEFRAELPTTGSGKIRKAGLA